MNKWIPISLLVFFGIYLLTTTWSPATDFSNTQFAGSITESIDHGIHFSLQ